MKILSSAAQLAGAISIHPVVDWPRFILSMAVFGGMLAYLAYALAKR